MFMTTKRHLEILGNVREGLMRGLDAERDTARTKGRLAAELLSERNAARAALTKITGMETPSCAPIGKRMAAVARGALPA